MLMAFSALGGEEAVLCHKLKLHIFHINFSFLFSIFGESLKKISISEKGGLCGCQFFLPLRGS